MQDGISTQAYIDRSLDAVRAQNDSRFSEMISEIRVMRSDMDGQFARIGSRIDILAAETVATRQAVGDAKVAVMDAKHAADQARAAANAAETVARGAADVARTYNWNILMAMIAVIAVILALAGLWMTAMQTATSLTN